MVSSPHIYFAYIASCLDNFLCNPIDIHDIYVLGDLLYLSRPTAMLLVLFTMSFLCICVIKGIAIFHPILFVLLAISRSIN